MGLTVKEGAKVDPVPEGVHHAVCFAVVDCGTQPPLPGSRYGNRRERKVLFMFELPDERMTFEREGVPVEGPRVISKDFTQSLGEKSNLRKFLVSWRGRQFTDAELKGFSLPNVLKANCMLNVTHNAKGYADIQSVTPLPRAMAAQKREPELPTIVFDLDEWDGGPFPKGLPQWVIDRIAQSDELAARDHSADGNAPPPPDGDPIPF